MQFAHTSTNYVILCISIGYVESFLAAKHNLRDVLELLNDEMITAHPLRAVGSARKIVQRSIKAQ